MGDAHCGQVSARKRLRRGAGQLGGHRVHQRLAHAGMGDDRRALLGEIGIAKHMVAMQVRVEHQIHGPVVGHRALSLIDRFGEPFHLGVDHEHPVFTDADAHIAGLVGGEHVQARPQIGGFHIDLVVVLGLRRGGQGQAGEKRGADHDGLLKSCDLGARWVQATRLSSPRRKTLLIMPGHPCPQSHSDRDVTTSCPSCLP